MPCDGVTPFRPLSVGEGGHEDCGGFGEPVQGGAAGEVADTLSACPNIKGIDFDAIRFLARELGTSNWIIPIFKAPDSKLNAKEQAEIMQENVNLMKILAGSNACTIINRMLSCSCVGDIGRLEGSVKNLIGLLLRERVEPMRVYFFLPFFAEKDSDKVSLQETSLYDFIVNLGCSAPLGKYLRSLSRD